MQAKARLYSAAISCLRLGGPVLLVFFVLLVVAVVVGCEGEAGMCCSEMRRQSFTQLIRHTTSSLDVEAVLLAVRSL